MSIKKLILIIVILFTILLIPILIFIYSKSVPVVSPKNPTKLNSQVITDDELRKVAEETYTSNSIDNEVLSGALDKVIERKILDKLSAENNVSVSDSEIKDQLKIDSSSEQDAKYNVLKNKITKLLVKNWEIYSIRFWIPADIPEEINGKVVYKAPNDLTASELKIRSRQILDAPIALAEGEKLLATTPAVSVAQYLAKKYSSLAPIIAVNNNFILDYAPGPSSIEYTTPEIFTENELTNDLYANTIRSMTTDGEIKKVQTEHNGGGAVFKLERINKYAPYSNFDDLLKTEMKKMNIEQK